MGKLAPWHSSLIPNGQKGNFGSTFMMQTEKKDAFYHDMSSRKTSQNKTSIAANFECRKMANSSDVILSKRREKNEDIIKGIMVLMDV